MPSPTYDYRIDWNQDGDFNDTGENVSSRVVASTIHVSYGRDQARALSPIGPGEAGFDLINSSRDYSPENTGSPLAGLLGPGKPVRIQATHSAVTYDLFRGYIDDFTLTPEQETASFTFVDALATVRQMSVSTPVFEGVRTGEAVTALLDAIGWPAAARDIDPGATLIRYWWGEGDVGAELDKLVASEGPPSLMTVGPDGVFIFRDRHHRLLRSASTTSQATFRAGTAADPRFSPPLGYDHGWRDVVNSVTQSVATLMPDGELAQVWSSDETVALADGQSQEITVSSSTPFIGAVTPEAVTDYTVLSGTVTVVLSRDSGVSATIRITASGGPAVLAGIALRAYPIPVQNTVQVHAEDSTSIQANGVRASKVDMPWAGRYDADAIAKLIVRQRADRLPIVSMKLAGFSDTNRVQQLSRDLSDRVTIVDSLIGLNDDFFIERIGHTVNGAGSQLHETLFGCEKVPAAQGTPLLRFDTAGAGFNDGKFGNGTDDPASMFLLDSSASGHRFDEGVFST